MRILLLGLCLTCFGCEEIVGGGGTKYRADFSGVLYTETLSTPSRTGGNTTLVCTTTYSLDGFVELEVEQSGDNVSGEGNVEFRMNGVSATHGCNAGASRRFGVEGPIRGTTSSFNFSGDLTASGNMTTRDRVEFTGSLSESGGSGTLTLTHTGTGNGIYIGMTSSGSATITVTLRR